MCGFEHLAQDIEGSGYSSLRPRDKVEDEDVGLVPLDKAIALSESDVCSRGESGVGIRLRSA